MYRTISSEERAEMLELMNEGMSDYAIEIVTGIPRHTVGEYRARFGIDKPISSKAVIAPDVVAAIRDLRAEGYLYSEIAKATGVSTTTARKYAPEKIERNSRGYHKNKRKKTPHVSTLAETEAAARAAGMSYGQYVLKQRMEAANNA